MVYNILKNGDKVITSKEITNQRQDQPLPIGLIGTVIGKATSHVSVEFDKPIIRGHSQHGKGRDGHCWQVHHSCINLYYPVDLDYTIDSIIKDTYF